MQRLGLYITMLLIVISAPAFAFPCSVCKCGDHAFFINNARLLQRGTWNKISQCPAKLRLKPTRQKLALSFSAEGTAYRRTSHEFFGDTQ